MRMFALAKDMNRDSNRPIDIIGEHATKVWFGVGWPLWLLCCSGCVWPQTPDASRALVTLCDFTAGGGGAYPVAGVLTGPGGVLYGATSGGGAAGGGTVFQLMPPATKGGVWTETVLHSFTGQQNGDGYAPYAGLAAGRRGALYGTTYLGGAFNHGAVFKLTPPGAPGGSWTEAILYSFSGGSDGGQPATGLVIDKNGALYGTTRGGGSGACPSGCGTIFELTPPAGSRAWSETILYAFSGQNGDGFDPQAALLPGHSGALYGATYYGGAGFGTVFELTPPAAAGEAWRETVVYRFLGGGDGAYPHAGLAASPSGALYGTTTAGGSGNLGAVFELTPPRAAGEAWSEAVVHSFGGGPGDGASPQAALVIGSGGAMYGTTSQGGPANAGTLFAMQPPPAGGAGWAVRVLRSFMPGIDGAYPAAGLALGHSGALYGTTSLGGLGGFDMYGTVFALMP